MGAGLAAQALADVAGFGVGLERPAVDGEDDVAVAQTAVAGGRVPLGLMYQHIIAAFDDIRADAGILA